MRKYGSHRIVRLSHAFTRVCVRQAGLFTDGREPTEQHQPIAVARSMALRLCGCHAIRRARQSS